MKRSFPSAGAGVAMILVVGLCTVFSPGCGVLDPNAFLGLETCDFLNCEGLFFRNLMDDHDEMTDMEGAEDHDDEGDDHVDDMVDEHSDGSDDAPMAELEEHLDVDEEGHDEATEDDHGSVPGGA